jgi:hypothetical protein
MVSVLLGLLLAVPAGSHSYWPSYYSAKSALSVGAKGLQAVVVIEVPTFAMVSNFREYFSNIDLMAEIEAGRFQPLEDEYRDAQYKELSVALELTIDGEKAAGSWQPVDSPANGLSTEGFFVYMLEFVFADAEPGQGTKNLPTGAGAKISVRLQVNVLEEEQLMLANLAVASDGWEVLASSIPPPEEYPELPKGSVLVDDLAMWSEDEVKRDLRVTFVRTE